DPARVEERHRRRGELEVVEDPGAERRLEVAAAVQVEQRLELRGPDSHVHAHAPQLRLDHLADVPGQLPVAGEQGEPEGNALRVFADAVTVPVGPAGLVEQSAGCYGVVRQRLDVGGEGV